MTVRNAERAKLSTKRRIEAGGRNLRVVLHGPAARALDRLTASGMTALEAIEDALLAKSPPTPTEDMAGFLAVAKRKL